MAKLKNILREVMREPGRGYTTKKTGVDPETETHEWEVTYDLDYQELYDDLDRMSRKLDTLISKNPDNKRLIGIHDGINALRRRMSRIITDPKWKQAN